MSIWQLIALSYASIAVLCGIAWAVARKKVKTSALDERIKTLKALTYDLKEATEICKQARRVAREHVKPQRNDGILVATIATGIGAHERESVVLPEIFVHRQDRTAQLDSIRAVAAEKMRARLRKLDWPKAPEDLRHAAELSEWRRCDRKDWQERDGLARRIANARRDLYRCIVKRLSERCGNGPR